MSHLLSFWPLLIILFLCLIYGLMQTGVTFTVNFTQINSDTHIRVGAQGLNKLVNFGLKSLYKTPTTSDSDSLINHSDHDNPIYSMATIKEVLKLIHKFRNKKSKRMACESITWETQVGINDPMGSALISGSLWGIKYYLLGLLSSKLIYIQKPQVKITPLYHHTHFNTELKCVLRIKLIKAILICIVLVWGLYKSKRKKKKHKRLAMG